MRFHGVDRADFIGDAILASFCWFFMIALWSAYIAASILLARNMGSGGYWGRIFDMVVCAGTLAVFKSLVIAVTLLLWDCRGGEDFF